MEANQVEPTPSGGLLSLGGRVEELLLSHVAKAEWGARGLLNLRLVCSTTKEWVDDLPLQQGRRLFANCHAHVDLSEEGSLEMFLEAPPPSHVTSLILNGADCEFDPKRESWATFVQIWSSRLESLYVDDLSLPLNCRLSELVAATSIRRLFCDDISCGGLADIPDFLLQLEELVLESGDFGREMEASRRKAILQILGSAKSLAIPNWTIDGDWELIFAADIFRLRKHATRSQFFFSVGTRSFVQGNLQNFVSAVAASPVTFSIRIQKFTGDLLRQVVVLVGEEDALKFFRYVESIKHSSLNPGGHLRLNSFPNLKRLKCDKGDFEGPIEFPRSLKFLKVKHGVPAETILPPFLTSLELSYVACSAAELLRSLIFISDSCCRLERLEIEWFCASEEEQEKKEKQLGFPKEKPVFANLRSLAFDLEDEDTMSDDFAETARQVLFEVFSLPRLSLTSLFVTFGGHEAPTAPLFDAALLSLLIEGPIGKTLCFVGIERSWVAEGAEELLATLERMAEENSRPRKVKTL